MSSEFSAQFNLHNRFYNNISQYEQGIIDLGITYKINKLLRVSGYYRIKERQRQNGTFSTRHQLYCTISARKKLNNFRVIFRTRLQAQVEDIYSSDYGRFPELYNRNKLTLNYELNKRFDVYVADDVFIPLNNFSPIGIDRNRIFAGTTIHLSKKSEIDCFFLLQQELFAFRQLQRDFIYGITYNLNF